MFHLGDYGETVEKRRPQHARSSDTPGGSRPYQGCWRPSAGEAVHRGSRRQAAGLPRDGSHGYFPGAAALAMSGDGRTVTYLTIVTTSGTHLNVLKGNRGRFNRIPTIAEGPEDVNCDSLTEPMLDTSKNGPVVVLRGTKNANAIWQLRCLRRPAAQPSVGLSQSRGARSRPGSGRHAACRTRDGHDVAGRHRTVQGDVSAGPPRGHPQVV